jgi:hypothetical protein
LTYGLACDNPGMAAARAQRFVVVMFDGVSLGITSFAFGVFDMAKHYGVLKSVTDWGVPGTLAGHLST